MDNRLIVFVGSLFTMSLMGCAPEEPQPQSIPAASIDNANVEKLLNASPGRDRHIASWDFVRTQATLVDEEFYEYSPISLRLSLAETPTEWSTATGERPVHPDADPGSLRISLGGFVFNLPWEPTRDAFTAISTGSETSGETKSLEWELQDKSDEQIQRLELRFRLCPE